MPMRLLTWSMLLLAAICPAGAEAQTPEQPASDTTGAVIDLTADAAMLHVRALYVNAGDHGGMLQYRLRVAREGSSTSTSSQGGTFKTVPGRTDTLSSVRINGQSGDRLTIHLTVLEDGNAVDSSIIDQPFPEW